MNEERRKQLCDAIISHLNSNPDTRHFGRESLVDLFRNRAERAETIAALDWLREKKYIKKLGAHTIGFGTGEGLNVYPMGDYDPFILQCKPANKKTVEPFKQLVVKRQEWHAGHAQTNTYLAKKDPEAAKDASTDTTKTNDNVETVADVEPIPQFVKPPTDKAPLLCTSLMPPTLKTTLNDEINSIELALKKTAPSIEQHYEKIGVLTRLSLIFSEQQPEVSALLDGIVRDIIELTEVMA